MSNRNKLITTVLACNFFVVSSAFAHIFQMPENNTTSVKKNDTSYALSGQYLDYTNVSVGIAFSAADAKNPGLVKMLVQEQEDWRGHFSVIPALRAYLKANPSVLSGAKGKSYDSDRWQEDRLFGKITPATESYSLTVDLSTAEARAKFAGFLRAIAPGVLLQDSALNNMIAALKL